MAFLALRADTGDLQRVAVELEAGGLSLLQNSLVQDVTFQLERATTLFAQQKMIVVSLFRRRATYKGIQAADSVDQALFQQKIQSSIHSRRCYPPGRLSPQLVHQGIGTQWLVVLPDQLQHLLAQRRQPGAALSAKLLGVSQRGIHAVSVIVTAKSERRLSHVRRIPSENKICMALKWKAVKMLHYNSFVVTLCRIWLEIPMVMLLSYIFAGLFRSPARASLLLVLLVQCFALPARAQVEVLASIKPLGLIAEEVVGSRGKVDSLLNGSASPHDYPLKVSDIQSLKRADLVLWVGPELETFLSKALAQLPPQQQLQAQQLKKLNWPSEAEGETGSADQHSEHFHERDPHLWLDPRNGAQVALALAERLAEIDPHGGTYYRDNAQQLAERLHLLDLELGQRLSKVSGRGFAVYHQGYSHFVERYNLNQLGYVTYGPEQRPGARHLYQLRQRLVNAQCLFTEPYYDTSSAKQMAQDLNLKLGHLDPLGAENIHSYPALIEAMANAFWTCLAGKTD